MPNSLFKPHSGGQTLALENTADELLIGSLLGCGKSLLLLMIPAQYLHLPEFNCIMFRSSWGELDAGLIKVSKLYYPYLKDCEGVYNATSHTWTFPSGATISFGYLESIDDIQRYRGIERHIICFDELSSFSEEVYTTISLWLRTTEEKRAQGYPLRVVSTSNPGGKYGDWILNRWNGWLSKKAKKQLPQGSITKITTVIPATETEPVKKISKTRSCVILSADDNPSINRAQYELQFNGMLPHIVKQLKQGDWDARQGNAEYFRRDKIKIVGGTYKGKSVRGWDLASSTNKTSDYTASILLREVGDVYIIEDAFRYKMNTADVEKLIIKTTENDGINVKQIIPTDPGAAGDAQKMYLGRLLKGWHFEFVKDNRKKVERAKPVSSICLQGNLHIIVNSFYNELMDELEAFSDDPKEYLHDDFVDSLATSFNALLKKNRATFREVGETLPRSMFGDFDNNDDWEN